MTLKVSTVTETV